MWFDAVLVKYWKRMLVEGQGGRAAAGRRSKRIRLAGTQSDERSSAGCDVDSDRRAEVEISDSEMSDATTLSDSESVPASRRPAANELAACPDHEENDEDEKNEEEKLEICGEARWEMAAEKAVDPVVVGSAHQCADDSVPACPPRSKRPDTILAVDCEMVGAGPQRNRSMLARCAVVDMEGNVLMDEYVQPTERVTDYRTKWSGIREKNLVGAPPFQDVRQRAANLIRGKLLIGHAIENDLRALKLPHPPALTRDTSCYPGLRTELAGKCTKV